MKIVFNYFNRQRKSLERNDENFERGISGEINYLLGKGNASGGWLRSSLIYGLGIERY